MKLWQKSTNVNERIEAFTIGEDQHLDLLLAPFDILGSIAHTKMLVSIDLLSEEELKQLQPELIRLYDQAVKGTLTIDQGIEDIHSQVELILTQKLGDVGKKIHSGRSRNDQVLVDLKMYFRSEIQSIVELVDDLCKTLLSKGKEYQNVLMPGYTHMQVAMPSSLGLWFGAYAESLAEDLLSLKSAFDIANRNPLGSAAGYGSSFPLDRQMTTDLLGFEAMNINVVYAQMTRGKTEVTLAQAMSNIAATLGKLSMDTCMYAGQNFGFLKLPDAYTTGSSIMPHKKNPDVFELIRGRCNQIIALPNELQLILSNLPSGYHRDLQQLKEHLFPAIDQLKACIEIASFALKEVKVNDRIIEDPKYDYLFTVEEVNKLVLSGVPFREAYQQVGAKVEAGDYQPDRQINHTHKGSVGDPGFDEIDERLNQTVTAFPFTHISKCFEQLLKS